MAPLSGMRPLRRLVGPDGTFGNRRDDPQGQDGVPYVCSDRVGAFPETLARFRARTGVVAAALTTRADGEGTLPLSAVPPMWQRARRVGREVLAAPFVDVDQCATLPYSQEFRGPDVPPILAAAGISELEVARSRPGRLGR